MPTVLPLQLDSSFNEMKVSLKCDSVRVFCFQRDLTRSGLKVAAPCNDRYVVFF